jgi:hypothetical protein
MKVWMDAWQLTCCGEPFSVGYEVEWRLNPVSPDERSFFAGPLGDEVASSITHSENHHSGDRVAPETTRGRVDSITAVYWRVGPRPGENPRVPNILYPLGGSALLEERDSTNGGERPRRSRSRLNLWPKRFKHTTFAGYIVDLTPLD